MLGATVYLIFFSNIMDNLNASGKQSARPQSAGDKPVLNELNHWMAQDFYYYCKDAVTEQYLSQEPEERAEYINQIRRRENDDKCTAYQKLITLFLCHVH